MNSVNPAQVVHPAMWRILQGIEKAKKQPLHQLTPQQARDFYHRAAEMLDLPRDPRVQTQDLVWAQRPARLYKPPQLRYESLPVLLFAHGGGFVVGGLETHDSLCRQLCLRSGWAVLALDYRLAPEHPFPAAVDDVWSALQALQSNAHELGLQAQNIAVGGDSAGGTLTAVAALMARDAGLPLRLQLLITPGTSAWQQSDSHQRYAHGFLLDKVSLDWFFSHYIRQEQRTDWRFAPELAADFSGLTPACFVLAECDGLVDEGLAYADALRAQGIEVDLDLQLGVTHDFIKMGRALPHAQQALDFAAQALRQAALKPPFF